MKKNIITLLAIVILTTSSTRSMDVALWKQANVPMKIGERAMMKLWIFSTAKKDSHEDIMSNLTECRDCLTGLTRKKPELCALLQDEKSVVIIGSVVYSIGKPPKSSSDPLSSQVPTIKGVNQKLFVVKSLCEHGKNCEECVDKNGWLFWKSFAAIRNLGTETCFENGPMEVQCSKSDVENFVVSVNELCRVNGKKGMESQVSDEEIKVMAAQFIATPGNIARMLTQ